MLIRFSKKKKRKECTYKFYKGNTGTLQKKVEFFVSILKSKIKDYNVFIPT